MTTTHPVAADAGEPLCAAVDVEERTVQECDGQVYWYPSRDLRPVPFDAPATESPP